MSIRALSGELLQKAKDELNEVPSQIEENISHIRAWLSKQPHINARTDAQWLLSFLRGCKFSLERTKEKIELFYSVRKISPEFLSGRDPLRADIQFVLNEGMVVPLPTPAGSIKPKTIIIRSRDVGPDQVAIATTMKVTAMLIDILYLEDDAAIVSGINFIVDMEALWFEYTKELTPMFIKKLIICIEDVYSLRVKNFLFFAAPPFVVTLYNIFKGFLSEKLRNRIHFVSRENVTDLCKFISCSSLPEEYGGDGVSLDKLKVEVKTKVESYREWFLEDMGYGVDNTKRLVESTLYNNLFGIEGSFRKLEID